MSPWSSAYKKHGRAVLSFLIRRLDSREEAEDLCQETFMRAMNAEQGLRDPAKMRPYLFRIANNLMINHQQRKKLLRSESELGATPFLELVPAPEDCCPERDQEWRELRDALKRELATLPSEQRRAFELGVLDRLPYSSIARNTGWSVAKVKINVYRARKKLIGSLDMFRPLNETRTGLNARKV